jgi:hypothetical protein
MRRTPQSWAAAELAGPAEPSAADGCACYCILMCADAWLRVLVQRCVAECARRRCVYCFPGAIHLLGALCIISGALASSPELVLAWNE